MSTLISETSMSNGSESQPIKKKTRENKNIFFRIQCIFLTLFKFNISLIIIHIQVMKNILYYTIFSVLIPFNLIYSQGIADKKIQAGLIGGFGLNLTKMGTSKMDKNGVGSIFKIGIGLHKPFKNSNNLGISTGLEFDFETIKYKSPSIDGVNAVYYHYNDTRILQKKDGVNYDSTSADMTFLLKERNQKPVYVTIPLMLLFRTDFIGDFRYFAKFGIKNSFLVSNKINDLGVSTSMNGVQTDNVENLNMSASGDMFFYRGSVGFFGGAEWNFTGSTSLVGEIGFFYGITPNHWDNKEENRTLFNNGVNSISPPKNNYFSNKSTLNQLTLKFTLLF